ncbi:hypothetical protein Trydic_g4918 [Trypoxylus dichotomus]
MVVSHNSVKRTAGFKSGLDRGVPAFFGIDIVPYLPKQIFSIKSNAILTIVTLHLNTQRTIKQKCSSRFLHSPLP